MDLKLYFTTHALSFGLVPSTVIFWTEISCLHKTIWRLQNTHISNDNGSFCFYVDFFLSMSSFTDRTVDGLGSISNTAVSYKKQELLILREHLCSTPDLFVRSVLLNFLVFCVVLYSLSLFGVLFPMLPVSLDCLFLLFPMLPVSLDCLFFLFPMLPVSLDCLFLEHVF